MMPRKTNSQYYLLKKFKEYNKKKYCFHCNGYKYPGKNDKRCKEEEKCIWYIWADY